MLTKQEFDRLIAQSEKTISAKVLADSINPAGSRLTTMELTYPRCVHSEFMTHRVFSRNSASSRAIPIEKMIKRVVENPFFPLVWGKNQKGMQAAEEITEEEKLQAGAMWLKARDCAVGGFSLHLLGDIPYKVDGLKGLLALDIHKQIGNRIVEPWMWITVICSGTQWENFFALRCHHMAEPHIANLAYKMRDAYDASKPKEKGWGQWHLPLVESNDFDELSTMYDGLTMGKISGGRCSRVSYLTHDGKRDPQADIDLCDNRLTKEIPIHASGLEHPAVAIGSYKGGNFDVGWKQLRKFYKLENITERQ